MTTQEKLQEVEKDLRTLSLTRIKEFTSIKKARLFKTIKERSRNMKIHRLKTLPKSTFYKAQI